MSSVSAVEPAEVRRIVALDSQPALRNLLITQRYHDLSEALRLRTGGHHLNWCTFGTWASKTAGGFIRGEEVPAVFRALLDRSNVFGDVCHLMDPAGLLALTSRVVSDASAFLMMGNLVVFQELAGTVAALVTELGGDVAPDRAKLERFQARLTEGDPQADDVSWDPARKQLLVTARGGQGLLREMVANYYEAMFETDRKKRAELLLLGNARGGIHEQTRLQTYIKGSLDVPITDTLLRHAHGEVDARGEHEAARRAAHGLVDRVIPAIAARLEKAWEEFATVTMMQLTLPEGAVHLGRAIPCEPGTPPFPEELTTIAHPELAAVLEQFDALHVHVEMPPAERALARFETLLGCGHPLTDHVLAAAAADWVDFKQRMRFILTLFRARATDPNLIVPPFTPPQLSALSALTMPGGPL